MPSFEVPEPDYDRYTNRQLAAVPLAVLALALAIIAVNVVLTGAPAPLGIDLAGGTELVVETTDSPDEIRSTLDPEPQSVQTVVDAENRYILRFGPGADSADPALDDQAEQLQPLSGNDRVVQSQSTVQPTFAATDLRYGIIALVVAFVGMSVVAFVLFRIFVPSIAIVISAFSDITIPVAVMGLLGFPLRTGTIAALLMLIGYSVDSDILLNNHVLRRGTGGGFYDDVYRAMSTGVTMTVTSMAAMATMAVSAFVFGIDTLTMIGTILFVGLAADLMNTYMLNLSLLRWYKFEGVKR